MVAIYETSKPNYNLLRNVHESDSEASGGGDVASASGSSGTAEQCESESEYKLLVRGNYLYYHYNCDADDDQGWGCGYRTLQTICSWINDQRRQCGSNTKAMDEVPTISCIQKALVELSDKSGSFVGSKNWIGCIEVTLCLEYFHNVHCKILHVPHGDAVIDAIAVINDHINTIGSPIMMSGTVETSAKCILGAKMEDDKHMVLILDPTFVGVPESTSELQSAGWLSWRPLSEYFSSSFYNLCLPVWPNAEHSNA